MSSFEVTVPTQRERGRTSPELDERIRAQTRASVAYYAAHPDEIDDRLAQLDGEWGVERWLQLNSSALSLASLVLGLTRSRKWLALTAGIQSFLLQHGVQGWCPPLVLLRQLGVRTLVEIDAERNALKALRGELSGLAGQADAKEVLRRTSHDGAERQAGSAWPLAGTSTPQRVPSNTSARSSEQIRRKTEQRIALYAGRPELREQRLAELDREWDVERLVQAEGPITTLAGLFLGVASSPKWLALPIFAQSMMLLHSVQGFYPMLPLFRRLGVRTEEEISAERYAIKALQGDFDHVPQQEDAGRRADEAFEATQPAQ